MAMHVDSMATIQALGEGLISERKRVKAQGRAWKSFIRPTVAERKHQISIVHVKSHTGLQGPEQQGNDCADKMAKKFMNQGEKLKPLPYFTIGEEKYLLIHQDKLIGGNIRTWLKEQETKRCQDAWRKLKTQGRLVRRFPQQIQTLTKLIKNWSIQRAEGRAWIFFIFAVCDWLPLNYRIHAKGDLKKSLCNLCQGRSTETTEHLFLCPALREEQNSLREGIDEIFKKWSIPYSSLGHLPNFKIKSHWVKMLQSKLSKNQKSLTLSSEKMQQLVEEYWAANKKNRHKAFPQFWKNVNHILNKEDTLAN
jgi:hypothetical protein